MNKSTKFALLGVIIAVAITTATHATDYSVFRALPLLPLAPFLDR